MCIYIYIYVYRERERKREISKKILTENSCSVPTSKQDLKKNLPAAADRADPNGGVFPKGESSTENS